MATTPTDTARVVVVQPRRWTSDGAANIAAARRSATPHVVGSAGVDVPTIVVLPELIGAELDTARYEGAIAEFARACSAWVVGGSHYQPCDGGGVRNRGVVVGPDGHVVAEYHKLRPYGMETANGVRPGTTAGSFDVGGRTVTVLICADFWFSESLSVRGRSPDLVAVPSFSISQRPDPAWSRSLWRHLSVARAYEFTTFVAVSDWAHPASFEGLPSSSVGGLADPNPLRPDHLFRSVGRRVAAAHDLDFRLLDELRANRHERGFGRTDA